MKKFFLAIICLNATFSFAQNVKSENLEYIKIVPPTLLNSENPIDLNFLRVTDSDFLKTSGLMHINHSKSSFITYNTSNPKYIAVLEYFYTAPYLFHEKKSLNVIVIKSNIEAKLYLIEAGKGVFYSEVLKLTNPENQNTFGRGYHELSTTLNKSMIPDAEAAPFFKNGKFPNPEKVNEVETEQMQRLSWIAHRRINEKMTNYEEDAKIGFSYLKEDKNFNSSDFDGVYSKVKQNLKPLNAETLKAATQGFKNEFDKYKSSSDKKISKYKEALLENIITLCYLTDDYADAEIYEKLMDEINPKNRTMSWAMGAKKKYEIRNSTSQLGQPLTYNPVPDNLLSGSSTDKTLTQSSEEKDYKIDKLDKNSNSYYIQSTIELNNLSYQLKAIQKRGLLPQHENDIFNKIIWTMMTFDSKISSMRGSEKAFIKDLSKFCETLQKEIKDKKVYSHTDGREERLMKMREYVSKSYKIEDFTKFIPSIDQAVFERTNEKKESTRTAYRSAIHMNSIVQMRDLLADDQFMEAERKSLEDQLDQTLEEQIKIYMSKNNVYYEFKKSIKVFQIIKNKRQLSKDEYENYEILMNNMAAKFIYNI